MANKGLNAKLECNTTGSTWITFGKYVKIKGPEIAVAEIKFKTLDLDAEQVLSGTRSNGMVSGEVVFLKADYEAMTALVGVDKPYRLTYPPGTTGDLMQTFNGQLQKLGAPEFVNDQLCVCTFEVPVNGALTNTTVPAP